MAPPGSLASRLSRGSRRAQGDEDLFSMPSAPEMERRPFNMPSSYYFSVADVAVQRGDVISFSDFWSFGADDRCAAAASAALRGDLDMLEDICDSIRYQNLHSVLFEMDGRESAQGKC